MVLVFLASTFQFLYACLSAPASAPRDLRGCWLHMRSAFSWICSVTVAAWFYPTTFLEHLLARSTMTLVRSLLFSVSRVFNFLVFVVGDVFLFLLTAVPGFLGPRFFLILLLSPWLIHCLLLLVLFSSTSLLKLCNSKGSVFCLLPFHHSPSGSLQHTPTFPLSPLLS